MTRLQATLARLEKLLTALGVPKAIREVIQQIVAHNACMELAGEIEQDQPSSLEAVARRFRQLSLERADIIGHDLLHDAAWHMILIMFADSEEDKVSFVSGLIQASGSPPTTALRNLKALENAGLIKRKGDVRDARRMVIVPQQHALDMMKSAVERFCVSRPEI